MGDRGDFPGSQTVDSRTEIFFERRRECGKSDPSTLKTSPGALHLARRTLEPPLSSNPRARSARARRERASTKTRERLLARRASASCKTALFVFRADLDVRGKMASPPVDLSAGAWGCAACTYLNAVVAERCVMCQIPRAETGGVTFPVASLALPLSSNDRHASSSGRGVVREGGPRAPGAGAAPLAPSWEGSILKIVGRVAAPATYIFNGTLTGVFAFAGACTGAVAGAVAAQATNRGVIRGAGIGAVAGAAISIEALDLARLLMCGHSVAGAMESRDARRRARGEAEAARAAAAAAALDETSNPVVPDRGHRAGRVRTAIRARAARRDGERRADVEAAIAGGDVELVLHELLNGASLASPPPPAETSAGAGLQQILEAILTASRLDNMTYEELLERFGPGVEGPAAAPKHLIRDMPTRTLTEEDASGSGSRDDDGVNGGGGGGCRVVESRCCVCLEDYAAGDVVKILPGCRHRYHAECIDQWLGRHNLCPVCRAPGVDESQAGRGGPSKRNGGGARLDAGAGLVPTPADPAA